MYKATFADEDSCTRANATLVMSYMSGMKSVITLSHSAASDSPASFPLVPLVGASSWKTFMSSCIRLH